MIVWAGSSQIRVCCEGVETEEEVQVLRELSPTVLQGFYFARPVSYPVFEAQYIDFAIGEHHRKKEEEIPTQVLALVEERSAARKAKDFAKADALRDQIAALGYVVEETRQGTKISKK